METHQLNAHYDYKEAKLFRFDDSVEKIWQLRVHEQCSYRVIPDNSVDLVYECKSKRSFVFISSDSFIDFDLEPGQVWIGIRFYPGTIHALIPTLKILSEEYEYSLKDVCDELHTELVVLSGDFDWQTLRLFFEGMLDKCMSNITAPKVLIDLLRSMYENPNLKSYRKLTEEVSQRQIQRYFNQYVGVSPKQYMRVARLQTYLYEASQDNPDIAQILYYDQSHLIKEVKKLTGLSVSKLLQQAR